MRWIMRMAGIAIIIVIVSLTSSMLTIGTTAIIVDQYIQTALHSFHIPLQRNPLSLTSMWGILVGASTTPEGTLATKDPLKPDPQRIARERSDGTLPVIGRVASLEHRVQQQEKIVVPPDMLSKNKEGLSKPKREKLFATFMKKLPQEEWQYLSTLMEDGLTSKELTEAEQILAKHLNDKEYRQIREWLKGEGKITKKRKALNLN